MPILRPLFMLADSRLLFGTESDRPFLRLVLDELKTDHPKVAYIGVSNGDKPEFYDMCREAWEAIGVPVAWIGEKFDKKDQLALSDADIVFLSGGDIFAGWQTIQQNGMKDAIAQKYSQGAVLVGLSAGAVQLGLCGWSVSSSGQQHLFTTFAFTPFVVDVHDEKDHWNNLGKVTGQVAERSPRWGIGIPSGCGLKIEIPGIITPFRGAVYVLYSDGTTRFSQNIPPGKSIGLPYETPDR